MVRTAAVIKEDAPKIYAREFVDLIFVQPYRLISDVVEAGIAQRQAASTYLKTLVQIGVLNELKVGREKLFINPSIIKALSN